MSIAEICQWLQHTDTGMDIRSSNYAFPIIEAAHVLGLAISVGTVVWLDLRLLGVKSLLRFPVSRFWKGLLPLSMAGFALMFVSGSILFWVQAFDAYNNVYFRIKIGLLFLAAVNALVFQFTAQRRMAEWDRAEVPPLGARLAGLFGIILWASVIIAGRTFAYNLDHIN